MNEKMTAMVNDKRLIDLARYKATDGMLKDATETEITKQFTSLKKRVKTGKTTLSKLEETIYNKLGVQEEIDMPEDTSMGFTPGGRTPMLPPAPNGKKGKTIDGFGGKDND